MVAIVAALLQIGEEPPDGESMLGDFDEADRWVDEWQHAAEERAEKARELSAKVAQLRVTARSSDGLVEVTVSAEGLLVELRLDDRIRSQSGERIAQQVLTVLSQAHGRIAGQVAQATTDVLGDSETARALISSVQQRFTPDGERP